MSPVQTVQTGGLTVGTVDVGSLRTAGWVAGKTVGGTETAGWVAGRTVGGTETAGWVAGRTVGGTETAGWVAGRTVGGTETAGWVAGRTVGGTETAGWVAGRTVGGTETAGWVAVEEAWPVGGLDCWASRIFSNNCVSNFLDIQTCACTYNKYIRYYLSRCSIQAGQLAY